METTMSIPGRGRARFVLIALILLLLGLFLPPNINGALFRDRLAPALGAALGRHVSIGQVKYRLLPRPGFDLYGFQVSDDPAFSAEPILMCGKVAADLRLTSLWHGRLEIANLKLTDEGAPPSLNLVYSNGHWNVESLLLRAGQVPSAPTAKRSAEQRPRFPYIEATGGRINFKTGAEKIPFTIADTDFALWLAAEDVWHVRLKGRPVRTDMNLNDTGDIHLEGDLRRSQALPEIPVKLNLSWENAQLGQFSSLVLGHDHGWRGALDLSAQLSGALGNLQITATADLSHFRRFDVHRDSMPTLQTRCLGDYAHSLLEMKCDTPLETGGLLLSGKWQAAAPRNYDLSLTANHIPLSLIAVLARHALVSVPEDLTATGDVNAGFGFHARNGVRSWHGLGMTTPFQLQASLPDYDGDKSKPFAVSSIKFHLGIPDPPSTGLGRRYARPSAQDPHGRPDLLTIDSFSIQLGPSTTLEVHGNLDGQNYSMAAKGLVPLERLLALGKVAGFQTPPGNVTASAVVDLNVGGAWANFAPAHVLGTARVENLTAWIPGLKDRLALSQVDAQLTDSALALNHLNGRFEQSPIAFTGAVSQPWKCSGTSPCPLEFELQSDSLAVGDVVALFVASQKAWSLPFLSSGSGTVPDFRARGTFSAKQFTFVDLPLENFKAQVEVGDRKLEVKGISARLGGGSTTGAWQADWSNSPPRYTGSGELSSVALDRLASSDPPASSSWLESLTDWFAGRTDAKYSFHFEGKNSEEMVSNATGKFDFQIANGGSRVLTLESARPLRFQNLEASLELEKQSLKVLPSKFRAENRIYEISGTVSLADKKTKLNVHNSSSRWEITGDLGKPRISPQPASARRASLHAQ